MPVLDETPQSSDFFTVELVNATDKGLASQTLMPSVYRMIATVMLQNGFEPGLGLGRNSQGIIEILFYRQMTSKRVCLFFKDIFDFLGVAT